VMRKGKGSVTDITQWRLWRQVHNVRLTCWLMRNGTKHTGQSLPIQRPLERQLANEPTPKGRAQIIPFKKAG
jgi:hypothetical protein